MKINDNQNQLIDDSIYGGMFQTGVDVGNLVTDPLQEYNKKTNDQ